MILPIDPNPCSRCGGRDGNCDVCRETEPETDRDFEEDDEDLDWMKPQTSTDSRENHE
jgi:hypothetical protein